MVKSKINSEIPFAVMVTNNNSHKIKTMLDKQNSLKKKIQEELNQISKKIFDSRKTYFYIWEEIQDSLKEHHRSKDIFSKKYQTSAITRFASYATNKEIITLYQKVYFEFKPSILKSLKQQLKKENIKAKQIAIQKDKILGKFHFPKFLNKYTSQQTEEIKKKSDFKTPKIKL